jgi:hypothetical protein
MRLSYAIAGGFVLAIAVTTCACGSLSAGTPDKPAAASTPAPAGIPTTAGTPAASGTPGCASGSGFALSLVSDRGGQPTPVRAAQWFAMHGGVPDIPAGGWREIRREDGSALVASGPVTVHVIEGPDRT